MTSPPIKSKNKLQLNTLQMVKIIIFLNLENYKIKKFKEI